MTILHKADFAVRELYYYDRFINTNHFDFKSWEREDIYSDMIYTQKAIKRNNEANEFVGYPMVYQCSKNTWRRERVRCLYKHTVKWKVPLEQIIDI